MSPSAEAREQQEPVCSRLPRKVALEMSGQTSQHSTPASAEEKQQTQAPKASSINPQFTEVHPKSDMVQRWLQFVPQILTIELSHKWFFTCHTNFRTVIKKAKNLGNNTIQEDKWEDIPKITF